MIMFLIITQGQYGAIDVDEEIVFTINNNFHYYVLQISKSINTIVSLGKMINGNVNLICYDSKDIVTPCLRYIS